MITPPPVTSLCRHKAFYVALVYYDSGYDVRLVHGLLQGKNHMEAQARVDGTWRWIDYDLMLQAKPDGFEVLEYYTLKEYFEILMENK